METKMTTNEALASWLLAFGFAFSVFAATAAFGFIGTVLVVGLCAIILAGFVLVVGQ